MWQSDKKGKSYAHGHTVSEVSGFVGASQRTIQRVYKQWCNTRGHETRRQNCGRKKILTERDQRRVSWLVNQNRFQTGQELLQSVNECPFQPVSERTLRTVHCDGTVYCELNIATEHWKLYAMRIWSRVPRKRLLLSQAHKAARLQCLENTECGQQLTGGM
ncbi:hypothetical protein AVEN_46132-1 [Araneus ventricosus]|uniref:Transposase Tc1-like domain-containing protein n=1 Tax=Araneus ventricosus TaxID=182803 RepID=A0A4Y2D8T7_ARAVE|nr:hypothetical protein AVEN_46132-1 [Araneus ventricosus]